MNRHTWRFWAAALIALLALAGIATGANAAFPGAPAASPATDKQAPSTKPEQIDCSQIAALGIDRQMNMHASEILARCADQKTNPPGGQITTNSAGSTLASALSPAVYGGADVNVILPDGTYPHVTQSENMTWAHGNTVVSNYNDSRTGGTCYGGISWSTDGGATFAHASPDPICSGHGTNYGDPIVVWNNVLNLWFAGDLATGCGGQGIGLWTSPNGSTWTVGACAHNGSSDDRESMWVDNNPSSPHYGRMYISWNNFAVGVGALSVVYSDNGTTWTPATIDNSSTFYRDVQITGDLSGSGTVFVASMDEGGGGLAQRTNHMFRSTDGGATWTNATVAPPAYGPGRAISGYFALMFSTIWRHEGWGEPAAVGNTVHLAWAQCGSATTCSGASDHGDIYYSRSTDNGTTWSAPLKMNTDSGTAMQWQPSLAATANGAVYVGWYDQREVNSGNDLNCSPGNAAQPCYKRYGRLSLDNGATWQTDMPTGDVNSPLPAQPDSAVQTTYEGDYDYIAADGDSIYDHWTDGRVTISGQSQQDVFLDKINGAVGTPTPTVTGTPPTATPTNTATETPTVTPTVCGGTANYSYATATGTVVPGVDFVTGSNCDDCDSTITLPFPFRLYDHTYTTANASSNGRLDLEFINEPGGYSNECLPPSPNLAPYDYTIFPYWDDLYGLNAGYGVYTTTLGSAPNRIFVIEWRMQYFPGSGTANFEVLLYENSDTARFDVVYGQLDNGASSATVGVMRDSTIYTEYECNGSGGALSSGLQLIFTQPSCGTPLPTNTPGGPTATSTPIATPTECTGGPAGWIAGPNLPTPLVRGVGVFFPANGKFYTMGGRQSDTAGSDILTPYEYDPTAGTWTIKSATFTDNMVNNMACGVVTQGGTPYIYCVGGSAAGGSTSASRVVRYDPTTDTLTTMAGDDWPGNTDGAILPGGFAVANNKLYVFGGFDINIGMVTAIWEYDPNAAGSHWTQKSAVLPVGEGYIPATTIGGMIYMAGGSTWDGATINDTDNSYKYDPTADTITTIATIPRVTAETRALTLGGQMWVMGGGRTPPNPSNEVDIYDPGTDSWSIGVPFTTPRRNAASDTDGSVIWLAGGYAADGVTPLQDMEVFTPSSPCPTESPTPAGRRPTPRLRSSRPTPRLRSR